jgi:fumarate reductase flavoprotein subunit
MNAPDTPRVLHANRLADDVLKAPVVIVGAGACGLTAAIRLREAGVDCLLLERDAVPSGSTALSSGFNPAAETRLQRALGIDDSRARFAADITAKAQGRAAAHLVDAYASAVSEALDALERQGIRFEILGGFLYPGHSARRMHAVPEKTGAALMAVLERTAHAAGADLINKARVRDLSVDDADRVIGVSYQRPDGSLEHVGCDYLLLACNGFAGNPAMVAELLPAMRDAAFGGHVGNDGSAITWGRELGARLADLGGYQGHGSWVTPQGALMTWAVMMTGGVQINARGERFHDETHGYSEAAVHVLEQPGSVAWNVFDAEQLKLAREFPDFVEAEKAGALRTAGDIHALAALIGCPAGMLTDTLESIAASAASGAPDPFRRRFDRALVAPYHAVKVTGALFHTQGGLDVDSHGRVLRANGQPFPNLLAAGGAARGVSGNEVSGYLSGNGLLSAVGGGWLTAGTIIEACRQSTGPA